MAKLNDAPALPGWMRPLASREQQRTFLIRDYLQTRIATSGDRTLTSKVRAFLRAYDRAIRSGSPDLELWADRHPGKPMAVLIYPALSRVGRIEWLPCLVIEANERLADLIRQTNPFGGPKTHREPASHPSNGEPARRRIPPRVHPELIKGTHTR